MDKLLKMLDKLSPLLKQVNANLSLPKLSDRTLSKPRMPRMPRVSQTSTSAVPKIPISGTSPTMAGVSISPASKKDPVKIAEQTQNKAMKPQVMDAAKRVKESMRVSKHGQWSIIKDEQGPRTAAFPDKKKSPSIAKPGIVDSQEHGFGDTFHTPVQSSLIHGLDSSTSKAKLHDRQPAGIVKKSGWWTSAEHPHNVWVKSAAFHPNFDMRGHGRLSAARREVLYHNMARDMFGMGKHVPTTAGFTHRSQGRSAPAESFAS